MLPDPLLLDRYELRDRLGRGGMGTVYRAFDHQLERFVAVKVFAAGEASDDARRRAEATALARVSHPNLVTLLDAHLSPEGDPTPSFLVLELVDGEDLRSRLDRGPLAAEEAAAIAGGIAEALAVVHGAGMVHRDLKPANILLTDSGVPGGLPHAKLADFGIAHLIGTERLTTAGTIIGTAGYLSPEQVNVSEPGPAADIYALGLVTLEALTGVTEYPGTPLEAVTARLARDPRIPASLPEDWRGLLGAMTARDPLIRPTALEVAVMARELAPQLAGWTLPAQDAPGELPPTVAMPAAELGGGALAGAEKASPRWPLLGVVHGPRRRRIVAGAIAGGSVLAVALALTLGSTLAPAFTEPTPAGTGGSTPRPSPTVTSPAQSVAPVVSETTAPAQTAAPAPAQPAAPAPAQHGPPSHAKPNPAPKPGPGKGGPGPGPGHGPGKGGG
ncbi:serine/threonine-protein kinase [Leifsonia sp. EB34]|uniref:serine/threonine-protein kinase n=1 Tax=Leifsonia sp. EB34 TaxID=3156303 RepID=UPI00351896AF